jgi:hypothetical protein
MKVEFKVCLRLLLWNRLVLFKTDKDNLRFKDCGYLLASFKIESYMFLRLLLSFLNSLLRKARYLGRGHLLLGLQYGLAELAQVDG